MRLPAGFDHARAETSVRQDSAQWAAEGVHLHARATGQLLRQQAHAQCVIHGVVVAQDGAEVGDHLRQFQQSQGLVADGYPTLELLQKLQP